MSIKVGVSGVVREVNSVKAGVSGAVRNVTTGLASAGGVIKCFWGTAPAATGTFYVTYKGGTDLKRAAITFELGMTFGDLIQGGDSAFYINDRFVYYWNDFPLGNRSGSDVRATDEIENGGEYYAM